VAEEKEQEDTMQGVSVRTLGNIAGLIAGLVGFAILVVGYTMFVDKRPIRSDYMVVFFLFTIALLTGAIVTVLYARERDIYSSK
jgi:hypothetical protein